MPLQSGTQLGPYEIVSAIGAGGMGEVYKARDTRLDRTVAIKVLPEHVAADPDLKQRFEREAKTISSLNHPHICTLYDIGSQDGIDFLVMEYLDGETLAQRLEQGALPLDQALKVAIEIADALDKAHRQGIVHRDLKPGNIMLTKAGAKLLDFGLAKLRKPGTIGAEGYSAMTESAPLTARGSLLGTLPYMAPEQLEGKEADHRTDIFAFGATVYEMATGQRAFTGDSQASLIGAILKDDPPPMSTLQQMTPPRLDEIVTTCLAKDPDDRWQSAGDLRREVKRIIEGGSQPGVAVPALSPHPVTWRRASPWVAGIAAGALVAGLALRSLAPASEDNPIRMLDVDMPDLSRVSNPVLDPSGESVIFEGNGQLWRRYLGGLQARPMAGTEGARKPFWSPDGAWIGFFIGREVYKVPVNGGVPVRISAMDSDCSGGCAGSWTDDGRVLMSAGSSRILWAPESGGTAESFLEPGADEHFHQVVWLGGESVAVVVDPDLGEYRVDVWDGSALRTVVEAGSRIAYDPAGFLLYDGEGGVWSAPIEPGSGALVGAPSLVIPGARGATAAENGSILVTVPGEYRTTLAWVDRDGVVRQLLASELTSVSDPDLAPDHNRIAVVNADRGGRVGRVWILDPELGPEAPLAPDSAAQAAPVWGADSRTVYYHTFPAGSPDTPEAFIRRQVIGIGVAETVVERGYQPEVSPDGNYLVWQVGDNDTATLHYRRLDSPEDSSALFAAESGIRMRPRLSPDGKFIAFLHSETGPSGVEVYVSRFPGGEDRVRVSRGGPTTRTSIRWDDSGRRLYYVRDMDGTMMEVELSLGDTMAVSRARELFAERDSGLRLVSGFDVNRDGSRFLVVREHVPLGATGRRVVLVENWRGRLDDR